MVCTKFCCVRPGSFSHSSSKYYRKFANNSRKYNPLKLGNILGNIHPLEEELILYQKSMIHPHTVSRDHRSFAVSISETNCKVRNARLVQCIQAFSIFLTKVVVQCFLSYIRKGQIYKQNFHQQILLHVCFIDHCKNHQGDVDQSYRRRVNS